MLWRDICNNTLKKQATKFNGGFLFPFLLPQLDRSIMTAGFIGHHCTLLLFQYLFTFDTYYISLSSLIFLYTVQLNAHLFNCLFYCLSLIAYSCSSWTIWFTNVTNVCKWQIKLETASHRRAITPDVQQLKYVLKSFVKLRIVQSTKTFVHFDIEHGLKAILQNPGTTVQKSLNLWEVSSSLVVREQD